MPVPSPIAGYFDDLRVDELLLNGARRMTIVRGLRVEHCASPFPHADQLLDWLLAFAMERGVRLDPMAPATGGVIEAAAKGSYRWHAVLPPLSPDGPLFCIRRHRFEELTLADFAGSRDLVDRLRRLVRDKHPLVVAGNTGSGKSSLLAALLRCEALEERVVILETLAELPAAAPAWIRLVARPANLAGRGAVALPRLFVEALRLRPDRIVLGEIRGAEELAVFHDARRTGHGGVLATLHAGSAAEARARLGGDQSIAVARLQRGEPPALVELTIA